MWLWINAKICCRICFFCRKKTLDNRSFRFLGDGVVCRPADPQEPVWGERGQSAGRRLQGHIEGPGNRTCGKRRQQTHLLWHLHSRWEKSETHVGTCLYMWSISVFFHYLYCWSERNICILDHNIWFDTSLNAVEHYHLHQRRRIYCRFYCGCETGNACRQPVTRLRTPSPIIFYARMHTGGISMCINLQITYSKRLCADSTMCCVEKSSFSFSGHL